MMATWLGGNSVDCVDNFSAKSGVDNPPIYAQAYQQAIHRMSDMQDDDLLRMYGLIPVIPYTTTSSTSFKYLFN